MATARSGSQAASPRPRSGSALRRKAAIRSLVASWWIVVVPRPRRGAPRADERVRVAAPGSLAVRRPEPPDQAELDHSAEATAGRSEAAVGEQSGELGGDHLASDQPAEQR